jgi:hypothetical protein
MQWRTKWKNCTIIFPNIQKTKVNKHKSYRLKGKLKARYRKTGRSGFQVA